MTLSLSTEPQNQIKFRLILNFVLQLLHLYIYRFNAIVKQDGNTAVHAQ